MLALTRRGHGDSQVSENGYDTPNLVEDIRQFLDKIDARKVIMVGHSLAGDEMTLFASKYPKRVSSLIYLDAAYDHATIRDADIFSRAPAAFALLKKSPAESTTLSGLRSWYSTKRFSFWSEALEANLRDCWNIDSAGHVQGERMPDEIDTEIERGISHPDYSKLQSRCLAIYSLPTLASWFPWISASSPPDALQQAKNLLSGFLIPDTRRNIELFRRSVHGAQIVELPSTNHYCFIQRKAEVLKCMKDFLRR